jgi:hypothetical protein
MVRIPAFDGARLWGPCPWVPVVKADGIYWPRQGDECAVVVPGEGDPWIASWVPSGAVSAPITGEPGPQGPIGPQGPQGPQGPEGSMPAPEAWREVGASGQPGFVSGWQNYGGGRTPLRFRKDPIGMVHVDGIVKRASGSDSRIFELPVGYRHTGGPAWVMDLSSAYGVIWINPVDNYLAVGAGNPATFANVTSISYWPDA